MKSLAIVAVTLLVGAAAPASAQRSTASRDTLHTASAAAPGGDEITKTIPLHHLSNDDAVRLLIPYLVGSGSVYPVGTGLHAVTVRATAKGLADAERALAQYDRSPLTLTLNFQLVAAVDTPTRDPAVAGLDSVLRGVLRFAGYRVLSSAVASVTEGSSASQTMAGDADHDYEIAYDVTGVEGTGADAAIHLTVELTRRAVDGRAGPSGRFQERLFSTGVTIPVGNTVVLGSAVEPNSSTAATSATQRGDTTRVNTTSRPSAGQRGLILTVRPMINGAKRRE